MKSPWQLGFLALTLTGVSTYDYLYFKNYRAQRQTSVQLPASQPTEIAQPSQLAPLSEPTGADQSGAAIEDASQPPISREELFQQARQAYISKDYSQSSPGNSWPERDPFAAREESESPKVQIYSSPIKNEPPVSQPQSAQKPKLGPQCVFSGTLVQGTGKLALVDGTPLAVGDRVGSWQLSRIESDFIILEADEEKYRIELKSGNLQAAKQKEPL